MDLDAEEPVKYYDDVYFDSDEEEMVCQGLYQYKCLSPKRFCWIFDVHILQGHLCWSS